MNVEKKRKALQLLKQAKLNMYRASDSLNTGSEDTIQNELKITTDYINVVIEMIEDSEKKEANNG